MWGGDETLQKANTKQHGLQPLGQNRRPRLSPPFPMFGRHWGKTPGVTGQLPLQTAQNLSRVPHQQGWDPSETLPGSGPACGPGKLYQEWGENGAQHLGSSGFLPALTSGQGPGGGFSTSRSTPPIQSGCELPGERCPRSHGRAGAQGQGKGSGSYREWGRKVRGPTRATGHIFSAVWCTKMPVGATTQRAPPPSRVPVSPPGRVPMGYVLPLPGGSSSHHCSGRRAPERSPLPGLCLLRHRGQRL